LVLKKSKESVKILNMTSRIAGVLTLLASGASASNVGTVVMRPAPSSTQASISLTAADIQQDMEGCTCDLTLGECDVNCCCDTDCESVFADYKEAFNCTTVVHRTGVHANERCFSKEIMYDVNPGEGQTKSIEDDVGGLLCIADDNTNLDGFFYDSADLATVTASSVQRLKNDLSAFQATGVEQATWEHTGYAPGQPLVYSATAAFYSNPIRPGVLLQTEMIHFLNVVTVNKFSFVLKRM
jgi:hypothetical protein